MTTNATDKRPLVIEDLKLTPISTENFKPYGTLVEATEDGTPFGPNDARLDLSRGTARFYIMRLDFRERVARRITRHRQVTQLLASVGGKPWQLVVAPPYDVDDPAAEPHLDELMAFEIPGNVGVMLYRGTWHAGPFFDDKETSFFNLELADTNEVDHQTCKLEDRFSRAYRLIA